MSNLILENIDRIIRKPKSTFLSLVLSDDSIRFVTSVMDDIGLENPVPVNRLHSTLLITNERVDENDLIGVLNWKTDNKYMIQSWTGRKDRVLVLRYSCKAVSDRRKELVKKYEPVYNNVNFIPHITISYGIGSKKEFPVTKFNFTDSFNIKFVSEAVDYFENKR